AALRKAGFEVVHEKDLSYQRMRLVIGDFGRRVRRAGKETVTFFYYSGHGASDSLGRSARNFLIPTEAQVEELSDLTFHAVNLNEIVDLVMASGARANFLAIDACRDVPFRGTKGSHKGFIPQEVQAGMLLSFATRPGETAADNKLYS